MAMYKRIIVSDGEKYLDTITGKSFDSEEIKTFKEYISEENLDYILNLQPYDNKRIIEKLFEEYFYDMYQNVISLNINSIEDMSNAVRFLGNLAVKKKWEKVLKFYKLLTEDNSKRYYEYKRLNNLIGYYHDDELDKLIELLDNNEKKIISIDSTWGSGKSTFIRKFKEEMELDYNIVYKDLTHEIALYDNEYTMVFDFFVSSISTDDLETIFKAVIRTLTKEALYYAFPYLKNIEAIRKKVVEEFNQLDEVSKRNELISNYKNLSIKQQCDTLITFINKSVEDTLLILDELDRLVSDDIIKVLNLINYLECRLSNIQVILVYNRAVVSRRLHKTLDLAPEDRYLEKYEKNSISIHYRDVEWDIYHQLTSYKKYTFSGNVYSIYNSYSLNGDTKFKSFFKGLTYDSQYINSNDYEKREMVANLVRMDILTCSMYKDYPVFRELIKQLSLRECIKFCKELNEVIFNFIPYIHTYIR